MKLQDVTKASQMLNKKDLAECVAFAKLIKEAGIKIPECMRITVKDSHKIASIV